MRRSVRLRPWQKRALLELDAASATDFLAVATPGAGKTTFALTAAIRALGSEPRRRVLVVAPTQHLKGQWAQAAADLGLHLDPAWAARQGTVPADMHGAVLTYQQVAADPGAVRRIAVGTFAVFDELHHAGAEQAWGDALAVGFERAGRRLALSGTPFRSDTRAIPFVRYHGDQARADFVYGYDDALREGGVVRPVHFPRVDGEMEWSAPGGTMHAHTFQDPLDRARAGQRLRTALSLDGEWLPAVLDRAHRTLTQVRRAEPDAGGLVIAMDQEHARGIAALMAERLGILPTVATSDDPMASERITRFAADTSPWIVAVRMVSEGVDIPRLRVGVFATNVVTELFFRQAVGRLVRWRPATAAQPAHLFIADDHRLRTYAAQIAEQRRHCLRRGEHDDTRDDEAHRQPPAPREDEQLSLFTAISAVATGEHEHEPEPPPSSPSPTSASPPEDPSLIVDLAPPPLRGDSEAASPMTRPQLKKTLREDNTTRARELSRLTGWSHRQVNAELNRLAGVRRVAEATVSELRARIDQADRWLRKL